jgi:hypothetical protein
MLTTILRETCALDLAHALSGKVSPSHVYSLDLAQVTQAAFNAAGKNYWSHNTLAMTVEPYVIANNLPYSLIASFYSPARTRPRKQAPRHRQRRPWRTPQEPSANIALFRDRHPLCVTPAEVFSAPHSPQ